MWDFLSFMTWEVWILLIGTAIVTGVAIWLAEIGSQAMNHDTRWAAFALRGRWR